MRQPRTVFPSDIAAMTDEQLWRFASIAAGQLAHRQGGLEAARGFRNIADALLRRPRENAA